MVTTYKATAMNIGAAVFVGAVAWVCLAEAEDRGYRKGMKQKATVSEKIEPIEVTDEIVTDDIERED